MRTSTTWTKGRTGGAGRKLGSRNRVKREVRALMVKLEAEDVLSPRRWLERLQEIAMTAEPGPAVAALRALMEFRFGKPAQEVAFDVEHGLAPSALDVLEAIGRSEVHRRSIEERGSRLLAQEAVTLTVKP
jgi:hypothetical protein